MANYDIFNGDADGICSLIQLRLAEARESILISGVKRDIKLLQKVQVQENDLITVLDLSMEKNQPALEQALNCGAKVFYADHHRSGPIPKHDNLEAHINTDASVCTALIIDRHLKGQYKAWALTAAFGDNLAHIASPIAQEAGFDEKQISLMQELGTYINYNGYGSDLSDLFYDPVELYQVMQPYATPFDFIDQQGQVFSRLKEGYHQDMAKARQLSPFQESPHSAIFILPKEKWARRVSGVFSNELANKFPQRAHAVLTEKADQDYLASIRAPKNQPHGADEIASQFPSGGGRKAAAGINQLTQEDIQKLASCMDKFYA